MADVNLTCVHADHASSRRVPTAELVRIVVCEGAGPPVMGIENAEYFRVEYLYLRRARAHANHEGLSNYEGSGCPDAIMMAFIKSVFEELLDNQLRLI